jgi:hypothetical protein
LSAAAQAAHAELFEMAQVVEAARSPAFVSGHVTRKTVKNRRYAYLAFKEIDGRKREYYLGPDGPAVAAVEKALAREVPALAALARQAAATVAQGCAATPPRHYRIVKRLADYQFFRAGGLLVGTQAFLALGNQLGVAWGDATRTLDIDFAHPGPRSPLAVAIGSDLKVDTDSALRSLESGFLPALGGSKGLAAQYVSEREPDLRVDFITTMRRSRDPVPMPELGIALTPLKFLDYLLEGPIQSVLLDRADACIVNVPDPARYGLHKLLVAAERGPKNRKYGKDIAQALALIEWHLDHSPTAIIDAWRDLTVRGKGRSQRAHASLAAAPVPQRELVGAFLKAVGQRS